MNPTTPARHTGAPRVNPSPLIQQINNQDQQQQQQQQQDIQGDGQPPQEEHDQPQGQTVEVEALSLMEIAANEAQELANSYREAVENRELSVIAYVRDGHRINRLIEIRDQLENKLGLTIKLK